MGWSLIDLLAIWRREPVIRDRFRHCSWFSVNRNFFIISCICSQKQYVEFRSWCINKVSTAGQIIALQTALIEPRHHLRSSSFVDPPPPTFCVSRVLACYASVWGPEYLWTIALYWGYKIRNLLEKLEKLTLLALVTILWSLLALF